MSDEDARCGSYLTVPAGSRAEFTMWASRFDGAGRRRVVFLGVLHSEGEPLKARLTGLTVVLRHILFSVNCQKANLCHRTIKNEHNSK